MFEGMGFHPAAIAATGFDMPMAHMVWASRQDEERVRNLLAPLRQGQDFNRKMDTYLGMVARFIGQRAKKNAQRILGGRLQGDTVLKRVSQITMQLRERNRNSDKPLREWGTLANSIQVYVPPRSSPGQPIEVLIGANPKVRSRTNPNLSMAQLAIMHEKGYSSKVTKRMKRYFTAMANNMQGPMGDKDSPARQRRSKSYNAQNAYTRVSSNRAFAWKTLAAMPVGKIIHVPARPFLMPAVKLAITEFQETYAADFAQNIGELWFNGRAQLAGGLWNGVR